MYTGEVKGAVLMLLCIILGVTGSGILSESIEYYFRVLLKRTGNQELWSLSQLYCQILIDSFSVVFFFKEWYSVETRSWFLLKKNMHNKVFEFHSTGAPHPGGGW